MLAHCNRTACRNWAQLHDCGPHKVCTQWVFRAPQEGIQEECLLLSRSVGGCSGKQVIIWTYNPSDDCCLNNVIFRDSLCHFTALQRTKLY